MKVTQEFARHPSPVLTIGRDSHVSLADLREGVPRVPMTPEPEKEAEAVALRTTGTDNAARTASRDIDAPLIHQTGRETVPGTPTGCETLSALRLVGADHNSLSFSIFRRAHDPARRSENKRQPSV
ncbi:MAG: hypothetical protein ACHRHE_11730 [Tepidisphaerales bacterium]